MRRHKSLTHLEISERLLGITLLFALPLFFFEDRYPIPLGISLLALSASLGNLIWAQFRSSRISIWMTKGQYIKLKYSPVWFIIFLSVHVFLCGAMILLACKVLGLLG